MCELLERTWKVRLRLESATTVKTLETGVIHKNSFGFGGQNACLVLRKVNWGPQGT